MVYGDGKHAHHIIPWVLKELDLVQRAAKSKYAFHINELLNGIPLPSANHLTGHSAYTAKVEEVLTFLNTTVSSNNKAYEEVSSFINYLNNLITTNSTKNLGEISDLINYP